MFIGSVTQFHDSIRAQVLGDNDVCAAFLDSSGVVFSKLELTLFSKMFTAMLSDAFRGHDDDGIYINMPCQVLTACREISMLDQVIKKAESLAKYCLNEE